MNVNFRIATPHKEYYPLIVLDDRSRGNIFVGSSQQFMSIIASDKKRVIDDDSCSCRNGIEAITLGELEELCDEGDEE